jgi:hypothetical protein
MTVHRFTGLDVGAVTAGTIALGTIMVGDASNVCSTPRYNVIVGSDNTITGGAGAGYNIIAGANCTITGSIDASLIMGTGTLWDLVLNSNIHGQKGRILLCGFQHFGSAEDSLVVGFHHRLDGRGTNNYATIEGLTTGTQVSGCGGSAGVIIGAGGCLRWFGTLVIATHHNIDGQTTYGDVAASYAQGTVPGLGTLDTQLKLSWINDKRLILRENFSYDFRFKISAGFIAGSELTATWEYEVHCHQGATGTPPLIRRVIEGHHTGTSGAVPSGWGIAFTAANDELVATLTLANPNVSANSWDCTGSFICVENFAHYAAGGGSVLEINKVYSEGALTAGRVPYAGADGILTDEAALAYNVATNFLTTGGIILATTTTPASAAAAGTTGMVAWDADYLYICIATNTWHRVAHATW